MTHTSYPTKDYYNSTASGIPELKAMGWLEIDRHNLRPVFKL